MKKIFSLFIIALLSCLTVSAQTSMRVNKTNGSTVIINIDEIESIDFPSGSMVYLNQLSWYLHPQQTCHLTASVVEDKALTEINANWSTSNAGIATVDATGCVTGVGDGTATITAEYLGETATMTVNVSTAKAFDISVTDITNTSCNYRITPKDRNVRYYYNMRNTHGDYSIDNMDDYGSVEENLFHFTIDWYSFVAEQYGDRDWNDAMQPYLQEGTASGDNYEFYSILDPGTEYTLYAIGFDENGNLSAPIETYVFETTAPQPSNNTFNIVIDKCLSTDAMFTVNPSNNDPYLVCVQSGPRYVEWFIEHDKIEDMAQPMINQYANDSRYPAIQTGSATLKVSDFVTPRSYEDYYVIVFGYNDGQTTPITLKRLRTESGWTEPESDIIVVTPPDDLGEQIITITADDIYADDNDETVYAPIDPMNGFIGVKGNNVYLYGFFGAMSTNWIMGTYDAAAKTVSFASPQYMGKFTFGEETAKDFYLVGGDLSTGKISDLVFDYDATNLTLTLRENLVALANYKPFDFSYDMMLGNYVIKLSEPLF